MSTIVSLTSTFERSHLLFYALQSLLKQSLKPDLMLLTLSNKPYLSDSGFGVLPDWLNNSDVKVAFSQNIGPYRKLLTALEYINTNDIIVTADDDILYGKNWLRNLLEAAYSEPDSIVCCRARTIKKNIFGNWQNYSNWPLINKRIKGCEILPTGCGGVVYRKRLLDLDFLNDHTFMKIAPTADDLWFRMASLRKNVPVAVFPEIDRRNIYLLHGIGLYQVNVNQLNSYSIISRAYHIIRLRVANYIGINQTKNDFSWDSINKYSRRFPLN